MMQLVKYTPFVDALPKFSPPEMSDFGSLPLPS